MLYQLNYWVIQEERRTGKKRAEIRTATKEGKVGISGEPADPKLTVQIIMICKGVSTGHCTLGSRNALLASAPKRIKTMGGVGGGGINLLLESIHESTKAQILELGLLILVLQLPV